MTAGFPKLLVKAFGSICPRAFCFFGLVVENDSQNEKGSQGNNAYILRKTGEDYVL